MNNIRAVNDLKFWVEKLQEVAQSPRQSPTKKKYLCSSDGMIDVQERPNKKLSLATITRLTDRILTHAAQSSDESLPKDLFDKQVADLSAALKQLSNERKQKRAAYQTSRNVLAVALVILSFIVIGLPFLFLFIKSKNEFKRTQIQIDEFANSLDNLHKENLLIFNREILRNPVKEVYGQLTDPSLREQPVTLESNDIFEFTIPKQINADILRHPSLTVKFADNTEIAYQQPKGESEKEQELRRFFTELFRKFCLAFSGEKKQTWNVVFNNLMTLHSQAAVREELQDLREACGISYVSFEAIKKADYEAPSPSKTLISIDGKGIESQINTVYKLDLLDERGIPNGETAFVVGTLKRTVPWELLRIPYQKITERDVRDVESTGRFSTVFTTEAEAMEHLQSLL